jgi:drug/metabolite transporter (DMT)-like permease
MPAYLALGICWGCSFVFIKESLGFLTPFGVAFGRCAFGAIVLTLLATSRRIALPRSLVVWARLLVVAMCMNVIPGVLFAVAETRTTSILAGIMNALTPLTTLLFMTFVFRDEPITRHQLAGLGLGLGGVLVVLGAWHGLGRNPGWAVLALLASVTLYGVAYPFTRRHLTPLGLSPISLANAQLIIASITLLPTFLWHGLNGHHASVRAVLCIVALGAFGSGLAFMWNFMIITSAGSSIASTVTYLTPVVAVVVGIAFLHESMTWYQPVGGTVVLLGAAVAQGRFART